MQYWMTSLAVVVVLVTGCDRAAPSAPQQTAQRTLTAETRAAAVVTARPAKSLDARACERPENRNDTRCDWYYDPMRLSAELSQP